MRLNLEVLMCVGMAVVMFSVVLMFKSIDGPSGDPITCGDIADDPSTEGREKFILDYTIPDLLNRAKTGERPCYKEKPCVK